VKTVENPRKPLRRPGFGHGKHVERQRGYPWVRWINLPLHNIFHLRRRISCHVRWSGAANYRAKRIILPKNDPPKTCLSTLFTLSHPQAVEKSKPLQFPVFGAIMHMNLSTFSSAFPQVKGSALDNPGQGSALTTRQGLRAPAPAQGISSLDPFRD